MKKAIPVVLILSFFVLLFPGPAAANLPIVFGKQSGYAPFEKVDTVTESPFGTDAELLRIPIYGFFVSAFFPGKGGLIMTGLYVLGVVVAILVALLFKSTLFKGEAEIGRAHV